MPGYHHPLVLVTSSDTVIKLVHFVCAVYIWEYFTTLYFGWKILPQMRKLESGPVVYTMCRLSALITVMCYLILFNVTEELNCNALFKCLMVCRGAQRFTRIVLKCIELQFLRNGVLLLLDHHTRSCNLVLPCSDQCILWSLWPANVAIMLYAIVKGPGSHWNSSSCEINHSTNDRWDFTATLIVNLISLSLCLIGIIGTRKSTGNQVARKTLYYCAATWAALLVFAVPPVALVWLNLSDATNFTFRPVSFIVLTVFTTRMCRGLYEVPGDVKVMIQNIAPALHERCATTPLRRLMSVSGLTRTQLNSITDLYSAQLGELLHGSSGIRENEGKSTIAEFVAQGEAV